jgi:hypothetical protein
VKARLEAQVQAKGRLVFAQRRYCMRQTSATPSAGIPTRPTACAPSSTDTSGPARERLHPPRRDVPSAPRDPAPVEDARAEHEADRRQRTDRTEVKQQLMSRGIDRTDELRPKRAGRQRGEGGERAGPQRLQRRGAAQHGKEPDARQLLKTVPFGTKIERLPGGHLTTHEQPEALAALIAKFEGGLSKMPEPQSEKRAASAR